MFIATNNAIYAVEDNGNGQPILIHKGTDHQDPERNGFTVKRSYR